MAIPTRTAGIRLRHAAGAALALLAACGPVDDTGTGPEGPPLPPLTDPVVSVERTVSLAAADLAYDPYRQVIYASVAASAGPPYANLVVEIDPSDGTIGRTVSLGNDPGELALSDDGRSLYVAHRGDASVSRVGLDAFTVETRIDLPSDGFASDVAALPGTPRAFAVALRRSAADSASAGVFVFDGATARGTAVTTDSGATRIEAAGSNAALFGYDARTGRARFTVFGVTSAGVAVSDSAGGLAPGLDFRAAGGRVYFTDGTVLDPDLPVTFIGRFPASGLVAPDPDRGRVFFLAPGGTSIRAFHAGTRALLREYTAPGTGGAVGSLIRLGSTGLAFRTATQVIIVPTARVLQ